MAKFLKELLPEDVAVLLPCGEEQRLRVIISMGLDNNVTQKITFNSNSALIGRLISNASDNKLLVKSAFNPASSQLKPAQAEQIKKEMDSIKAEVLVPMYDWVSKNKRALTGALSFGPKLYGGYTEDDLEDLFWLGKGFSTVKKDREIIEKIKGDLILRIEDSYELGQEPKILEDLRKKFLIFEAERITKYDVVANRKKDNPSQA